MSYNIRRPQITAPTTEGQISQIKSYLFQLADTLGFALGDLARGGTVSASAGTTESNERAAADPELEARFVAFQSQIIGGSVADTMTLGKRLEGGDGSEVDIDLLRTPGCYYSPDGNYIEGIPAYGGFRLEVKQLEGETGILQVAYYEDREASRYFDGTKWTEWAIFARLAEQSIREGWHCRKWRDGTFEAFGIFAVTPSSSMVSGTLYRTNNLSVKAPFAISKAVITGTVEGDRWLTNAAYANNAISFRIMSDGEIATSTALAVQLHVSGTYA